jgi:hypothetical protein
MPYYVRVLSTSSDCVPLLQIQSALKSEQLQARVIVEKGRRSDWTQIVLSHDDGREISLIERNVVEEDSLGSGELAEFADEVRLCKPVSASEWLLDYFLRVRCIYAFQVLSGVHQKDGWGILGSVKSAIWSAAPSILQADCEGFSNEDGYHILWQFNDKVKGTWWMGVLRDGKWTHFQMDLGSQTQRESFFQGLIPEGSRLENE